MYFSIQKENNIKKPKCQAKKKLAQSFHLSCIIKKIVCNALLGSQKVRTYSALALNIKNKYKEHIPPQTFFSPKFSCTRATWRQ